MKKLIYLFLTVLIVACGGDDGNNNNSNDGGANGRGLLISFSAIEYNLPE